MPDDEERIELNLSRSEYDLVLDALDAVLDSETGREDYGDVSRLRDTIGGR